MLDFVKNVLGSSQRLQTEATVLRALVPFLSGLESGESQEMSSISFLFECRGRRGRSSLRVFQLQRQQITTFMLLTGKS